MASSLGKDDSIIIVGAGVFGLSLAYELASARGYTEITVLDRSLPPVPDGSSVDISRIIRSEYADEVYSRMAKEAMVGWRTDYSQHYHEDGFVLLAEGDNHPYVEKILEYGNKDPNTRARAYKVKETPSAIKQAYPAVHAKIEGMSAVHNPEGGWADAAGSVNSLAERASRIGVNFVTGRRGTVVGFEFNKSLTQVTGVRVRSGPSLRASRIVLATGAWTNTLVPNIGHAMSASGQPVGFIQLSPEEAAQLKPHPVLINMTTGVFCFPPSPDNILKLARHGYGYANRVPASYGAKLPQRPMVSAPNRDKDNSRSGYLPDDADQALREGLQQFFPAFADRPWSNRRLCWYTDTPDGDFVVDNHSTVQNLFFATGGAGHGFKFLPVLGKYLADCFEDKAPSDLRHKWRLRPVNQEQHGDKFGDGSRAGPPLRQLTAIEQANL
ncbi:uncharacterized protein EKO05_0000003 [Ascochyta rabiei]|uniref:uncharacterized protein n=1 Tax=Didymella rabiei TaxID=5454 RepID=UPI00190050F9|nr:uncharacterized protein EKO05_0000003 [Ascochyta rabiei]UPX09312.1 hypothetical protein EKO05_0000003 [Ascochyta rabiei]